MEQNTNEKTNCHDLFSLYRSLVGPFQEFENRSRRKLELEWKLEQGTKSAKEPVSFNCKKTIRAAFSDTLKWAIPFLIIFWIIMNVVQVSGEKLLLNMFEDWTVSPICTIFEPLFDITLIYIIMIVFAEGVAAPCLIFLFPFMLIRNVISEVLRISRRKKKNEETLIACEKGYKELLPQAEKAMQEAWKKIAPYINSIPQDYRNSQALAFFSNSFFNSKVKNLQEAVNLYDQYLHQQKMEQSQREIAEAQIRAQRENMDAIDALSRQMAYMQDQLQDQIDSLNYHYY